MQAKQTSTKIYQKVLLAAGLFACAFAMASQMSNPHINHLAKEKSRYLRQHSKDPVEWYPWGEAAFSLARSQQKPIFVSIGFSSCYWCHVMERESFSNPEIARYMNEHFINVQVDREERPDVDDIYVRASMALTGSAGWPLTLALTPDLKPFFAGTYFPSKPMFGRPAFIDVLKKLDTRWKTDRSGAEKQAEMAMDVVKSLSDTKAEKNTLSNEQIVKQCIESQLKAFDPVWGGFGADNERKFPVPCVLDFFIYAANKNYLGKPGGDSICRHVVDLTLEKLGGGGIHDQVDGGFFRFSMDEEWQIPHFEKMLCDNALLVSAYVDAYKLTGRPYFLDMAKDAMDFILSDLRSPEGAFYSSFDSESGEGVGAYYCYTPADAISCMSRQDATFFNDVFNIKEKGNYGPTFSVPRLSESPEKLADKYKLSYEEFMAKLKGLREKMQALKQKRKKPERDEKIICSWNALTISALAKLYAASKDQKYLDAAKTDAAFLLTKMRADGKLRHYSYGTQAANRSLLEDYAYTVQALKDMSEIDDAAAWDAKAHNLCDEMIANFRSKSSQDFVQSNESDLPLKRSEYVDSNLPAAGVVAIIDFMRLQNVGGQEYREFVEQGLQKHASEALASPGGHATLLKALCLSLGQKNAIMEGSH